MSHVPFDPDDMFCTAGDVEFIAGYNFTHATVPNREAVSRFAEFARAPIVQATDRAGAKYTPPSDSITDANIRDVLIEANAVGAAWRAWEVMARTGDPDAPMMAALLKERFYDFIGRPGGSGGGSSGGGIIPGIIETTIESAADSGLLVNDITVGETTLADRGTTEDVKGPFAMSDVD